MPKRRNKGEGSVYYSDSKKLWICQVTLGYEPQTGKQIRKTLYAKTKSDLIEKKKEFEKKENLGSKEDIAFDTYFYKFLYKIKKPELKPKSWERYEGIYNNYIKKSLFFGSKLKDITYSDIQIWYNNENIPHGSLELVNMLIKSCLKMAKKDKIINDNILDDLSIKRIKNTDKYNVFTADEQKIFIEYLKNSNEPLKNLLLFTLATGLRLGEVLALEKTDIKDNKVFVNKNLQKIKSDKKYVYDVSTTKTAFSVREVPLPQKIIDILPDILNTDGDLLFADEETKSFIFPRRPLRHIQSICKKLNITVITFHGLRHTYATRLFESGVSIKTVQKLMGHSDIQTTMNIYTHVMPNIIDEAVEKLNNFL
ncbi:tyrosine-type recombinase/integrase [Peptoanaerobacter stomatis]